VSERTASFPCPARIALDATSERIVVTYSGPNGAGGRVCPRLFGETLVGYVWLVSAPHTRGVEKEWERPEYPWQFGLPPWAPAAGTSTEAERRRRFCETLFGLEEAFREGAAGVPPSSTKPRPTSTASLTAA